MKTVLTNSAQIVQGIVKMDHLNIGLLILAGISFLVITILFIFHSKKFLSHVSESLKDPVTGKWSPKICITFMASSLIFIMTIVWLKYAFVQNDFTQLQPIMIIHYSFIFSALAMKMAEKMQGNKLGLNGSTDVPSSKTNTTTTTITEEKT